MQDELTLGSLDAVRDWSFAGDIVRGAWLMLQQEQPDDYVLASGVPHTVAELAEAAFACVDLDAERYLRVDSVARARRRAARRASAIPRKARERLGWEPQVGFEELVERMVQADLRSLQARGPGAVASGALIALAAWMATVGVIGLGYVGLPLAVAFAQEGCEVVAVDVDPRKIEAIAAGDSYIEDVSSERSRRSPSASTRPTRYARLAQADAVLICVPTPLTRNREPDLGAADRRHARARRRCCSADQLVVLESTTYPGHHARARGAAAGGVGAGGRAGLPPRVLARARRPGPHRLHAAQHARRCSAG